MTRKTITAVAVLMLLGLTTNAQDLKIGYVNVEYILSNMPETEQIQSELQAYEKQLSQQLQTKGQQLQQDFQNFQQGAQTMTQQAREEKQQELRQRQQQLQQESQQAQVKMQQKQAELFQPAYNKIQTHIDQVAEENGYTYIFRNDAQLPIMLHAPEEDEVSNMVLQSMGITPPESGPPEEPDPDAGAPLGPGGGTGAGSN